MKYWDSSFEFSRRVEFQLWRRSNPLFFFGGTLQFGLAKTAVEMGFKAEIFQKARLSEYHTTFQRFFGFLEDAVALDALRAKVPIHYGREVLDVILESLILEVPPIVFLNLKPLGGENVLHWLVVVGMNERTVYVNDPYVPEEYAPKGKKGYPVDLDGFRRAIATDSGRAPRLPPCTLLIHNSAPT